ncbi:MAG: NAD(P)/FAD-dependent oxidoreductase [Acidobacteriota bacterium]
MPQNIAIIGSGFLGMTLALRLSQSGAKVTIFESADQIGGLASSWKIGEFEWDRHYHVTLASDSFTRKIIGELGLGDDFNWVETKTGFYTEGQLYSMSDTLEFLRFPPLGLINKLRLGATIFVASRRRNWKALEKIPVEKWLTRLSGKRTFEKIWRPLLKAKLGDAYKTTSAAFIWATIQRMYAARRTGLKKEMFGYVRGGYARVLERFSEALIAQGVEIHFNSRIESLNKLPDGSIKVILVESRRRADLQREPPKNASNDPSETKYARMQTSVAVAQGYSGMFLSKPASAGRKSNSFEEAIASQTFDEVILTCPSKAAAEILPQLSETERAKLRDIKYQGIVCASVLLKCSLSNFYVTNITDDAPFTAVIEMSALVDKKHFGRNALIYLPKYVAPDDDLFEKSDDDIRRSFLAGLEKMYPMFRMNDVLAFNVSRVRNVFPLPTLKYSETLPAVETSLGNVFVLNSSHIVNGTLNVNETIQLAENFVAGRSTVR